MMYINGYIYKAHMAMYSLEDNLENPECTTTEYKDYNSSR